ncbi:MAG: hypothetical protein ACXWJJ_14520 [Ramlibacter sp.]
MGTDQDRVGDGPERAFADTGVGGETFDVEQTPVGLIADLRQGGQVTQPLPDAEVTAVVDGRLGA